VTETPVEDVPQRTLNDILSEIINHLDLNPAHRLDLLGAVEGLDEPGGRPAPAGDLKVTTTSLPPATSGTGYSATVAASGAAGNVAWAAEGLPSGLTISLDGVITGKTTVAGTWPVTVRATAAVGAGLQTAKAVLSLVVA